MSHLKIIIIIKKETTFKQHLLYNRNPLGLLCTLRGAGEPLPRHPARTHSYGSPSHGGRHTFPFAPSSGFPRRALLSNSVNAGPAGLGLRAPRFTLAGIFVFGQLRNQIWVLCKEKILPLAREEERC